MKRRNFIAAAVGGLCGAVFGVPASTAAALPIAPLIDPDPIGTMRAFVPNRKELPSGWVFANGEDNRLELGGSGFNFDEMLVDKSYPFVVLERIW